MTLRSVAIGIDLGTTNSVVAVCEGDAPPQIIKDEDDISTRSYVHYTGFGPPEVGQPAYDQRLTDPLNTVHSIKQIIGRQFDDRMVSDVLQHKSWAFSVVKGPGGGCRIQAPAMAGVTNEAAGLAPEDISSAVLRQLLANAARAHLHVHAAVITVPATFGDAQRQATKRAAEKAGIANVQLMNEPSAAAFAYADGVLRPSTQNRHVLVFDLGGGTLDVAVLYIPADSPMRDENGGTSAADHMCIRAVAADLTLGGDVFTQHVAEYCLQRLTDMGVNVSRFDTQPRLATKLWDACETAKKRLSQSRYSVLDLSSVLPDDLPEVITITHDIFRQICAESFDRVRRPLDEVLLKAGLDSRRIDTVLLVGRATRMPHLQSLLAAYFGRDASVLSHQVDEAEAVAKGAAIMAASIGLPDPPSSGSEPRPVRGPITGNVGFDVLAHSLSIVCRDGRCFKMLQANTPYPQHKHQYFEKQRSDQDVISISVVEGDSKRVEEDTPPVGHFMISGLRQLQRGVDVTLAIDASGILEVKAVALDDPNRAANIRVMRSNTGPWVEAADVVERLPEELQRLQSSRRRCDALLQAAHRGTAEHQHLKHILAILDAFIIGHGGPYDEGTLISLDRAMREPIVLGHTKGFSMASMLG